MGCNNLLYKTFPKGAKLLPGKGPNIIDNNICLSNNFNYRFRVYDEYGGFHGEFSCGDSNWIPINNVCKTEEIIVVAKQPEVVRPTGQSLLA